MTKLQEVLVKLGPKAADVEARVKAIVAECKVAIADGKFNYEDDIKALFDIAILVARIAKEDKEMPREDITPLIGGLMHWFYFDPKGLNDPDLKFIPKWMGEELIEHELIDRILPWVVECVVKLT